MTSAKFVEKSLFQLFSLWLCCETWIPASVLTARELWLLDQRMFDHVFDYVAVRLGKTLKTFCGIPASCEEYSKIASAQPLSILKVEVFMSTPQLPAMRAGAGSQMVCLKGKFCMGHNGRARHPMAGNLRSFYMLLWGPPGVF